MKNEVSDEELLGVIADFIEQGLVENIVSMFRQDPACYRFSGDLLRDERFMVRVGTAVLFEWLKEERPGEVVRAIPFLAPLLVEETAYMRGEAVNLLGIIGTDEALAMVRQLLGDPDPQVAEIARDILGE